ncbi:thioredoxin [Fonsecaea nubica]|uniref:Thioredoxin n=1 Tax=Fonsecaea nubica TaxID=856822 RepID=A0A178CX69_9EURO|nr:thioredoxin [Fonsecaea nubica]OAL33854.1 thioredoxin [Fonsecaea nubica]
MSSLVHIESTDQFSVLLSSSKIVVADFYADWFAPCRVIAPIFEQLAAQLSRPNKITFARIDTDKQQDITRSYGIRVLPTFVVFKNAQTVKVIQGGDREQLSNAVKELANEANKLETGEDTEDSSDSTWVGLELPRGYRNVTSQVDVLGMELLNWDSEHGNARTLISGTKPKGKAEDKSDWVESDTDEQLMLYLPFMSTLKIHSLHLTSLPDNTDDDESPSRPKLVKVYTNRPRILGFDEADDTQAAQEITLSEKDWDAKTGTAKIELRIVKFQNVSSLVVFVVESEGDNEKVRIDRIRVIGETGEKRDGKIEKIGGDE